MTELQDMSKAEEAMLPKNGTGGGRTEGSKTPQYIYTLLASILVFSSGTTIGWSSPALPILEDVNSTSTSFHVTPDDSSWIGSLLAIGAFIGAVPAGSVADAVGRKLSILGLSVPLLISWAMIFFASGVSMLYAARLVGGVALGAICTIVPMYIGEIAEDSIRGTLGATFPLALNSGICYTYVLGALLSYNGLVIVCGILPILSFFAFLKAPETPSYLLKKGERAQAERSISAVRGADFDAYKELRALEDELEEQQKLNAPFGKIAATPAGTRALIISFGLMAGQQLSGVTVIVFFAGMIFQAAGSSMKPEIAAILLGITMIVIGVLNLPLIEKAGRKILLQISSSFCTFSLLALGYYSFKQERGDDVSAIGSVPVIAVVAFMIAFSLGLSPVPWMISGEIMPPEIKATSIGIATGLNWMLAFLVTKAFKPVMDIIGAAYTYYLLALFTAITFVFVTCFVIETKGKSLAEIQGELAGKKPVAIPQDENLKS